LQKAGKYQEAIASLENVLRLNPSGVDMNMANTYSAASQPEKSTEMPKIGLERARVTGDAATAEKFTARLNPTH
jgi:hypothetical protein